MAATPSTLTAAHAAPAARSEVDGFSINHLTNADLRDALRRGLADFQAMPSHILFIAAIYPAAALVLAQLTYSLDIVPMLFPLVAGFALVGPLAGLGLYEISRRRERGETPEWREALEVRNAPGIGAIVLLGLILFAIFALWLATAQWLYTSLMGAVPARSAGEFLHAVLTTEQGWSLIIAGHVFGFVFAALAFAVSAVSFPLLLDRPVGAGVAIAASVQTIRANPAVMARWAAIVAGGLMLGSALLFVGLVLVLPILAHASWHLYRRAIRWG